MNDIQLIRQILVTARTIAVVGISNKPQRPSYFVAAEMQHFGYRVVPVNPVLQNVLGETCYASLRDIPFPIDLVDVFRSPEFVPQIVEESIAIRAKYLWLQEGVTHPEACATAEAAGIGVVADRCWYKEYANWRAEQTGRTE